MRIGFGYDVHQFCKNRPLILGGVHIPYECGLLGHSDADVLVHALMDSLLGACALGDIGKHFPDTDQAYRGIDSMILLSQVVTLISEQGYSLSNADITIVAQHPKLAAHIDAMRTNIASVLHADIGRISIKATTEEHLGFTGRQEGIKCYSVCLLSHTEETHETI